MPRKQDSHWGEDGFPDPKRFFIKSARLDELLEMTGLEAAAIGRSTLDDALTFIGQQYWNWHRRGPEAFTRGQARQALEELLRPERIDYRLVATLNERAHTALVNELWMMTPAPVPEGDTVIRALMEDRIAERHLRTAAVLAIDRLKDKKGRNRKADLDWAVDAICELYRALTGKEVTHSQKGENLAYQQAPQSPAGRFVHACMKLIDPEAHDSAISRALRCHVAHRDRRRRKREAGPGT